MKSAKTHDEICLTLKAGQLIRWLVDRVDLITDLTTDRDYFPDHVALERIALTSGMVPPRLRLVL
jgi:hypothetical protein